MENLDDFAGNITTTGIQTADGTIANTADDQAAAEAQAAAAEAAAAAAEAQAQAEAAAAEAQAAADAAAEAQAEADAAAADAAAAAADAAAAEAQAQAEADAAEAQAAAEDDFAADITTTGVLTVNGGAAVGNVDFATDADFFAVDVVAGELYIVNLTGVTISNSDILLNLNDSSGNFLAHGAGADQVVFRAEETGTVFIETFTESSSGTGEYNLTISTQEDDFDADVTTTGVLTADGAVVTANIDYAFDRDWFTLDVVAGETYTVDLTGVTISNQDVSLLLFDSSGSFIAHDFGINQLTFTASETGTVFVEANAPSSRETGEYNLTANIAEDDFSADVSTTGVLTADGAVVTGNIDYTLDEDWFALEVTQGEAYNISFASPLSGAELDVHDSNGVILLESSDTVSFTAQTTETIYISASGAPLARGNYELSASVITEAPDLPALFDDFAGDASTTGRVHVDIIDDVGFGGDFIRGSLETAGDDDWFAINVQSAVSVEFFDFSDISEDLDNLTLSIFDSNGALVTSGSGPGFSFDFVETGTYFLSVTATDGVLTTDYEIDAFATPIAEPTPEPVPEPEPAPEPEPTPELPVGPNFLVTNTNDFGEGSLRQAILDSNDLGGNNTIDFAPSLLGQTIEVLSTLPINANAVINGDDITISAAGNNQLFRLETDDVIFENNSAAINFGLDSTSVFNSSAVVIVANDASFINNGIINTVDTSIFVGGNNFTLTNSVDGEISGGSEAVSALSLLFSNPDNDGFTTINNAGLLEGSEYGIFATTAQVTNSGTIQSLGVETDDVNSDSFNSAGILLLGTFLPSLSGSDNLITNTETGLIQGGEVGIGLASGGTINNAGNVVAELNTILLFGSLAGPDAPADYIINNSGTLARTGTDSGTIFIQATIGVDFNVTSALITNSGLIQSTGLAIAALSGTTLNNQASGAIQSDSDGIDTSGDGEDGIAFFATTQSELERVDENGELVFNDIEDVDFGDTIDNQGQINGDIVTGLGDDSVTNTGVIDGDISLGAGNDTFISSGTNNGLDLIIDGGEGDDVINGGEGLETVVYADARSRYSIAETNGVITITDTLTDEGLDEGTDTLTGVEFIQFSDGTFAVDSLINEMPEDVNSGVTLTNQGMISGDISFTGLGDDSIINIGVIDGDISLGGGDDIFISEGANGGLNLRVDGGDGSDLIQTGHNDDTLRGLDGNDTLIGGGGDDVLSGNTGDDIILGGSGDDRAFGGADNDVLDGGAGDDNLRGGSGDDTLNGGDGADVLVGANGEDILHGDDGVDTLIGGAGNDILNGDAGNDILAAQSGDDTINGGDGEDQITGQFGADIIDGGADDDNIFAGAGEDTVFGGSGDDTIRGEGQNDLLHGGDGDDLITGGGSRDTIFGDADNDTIFGQGGLDIIHGGTGNDTLSGGTGNDVLFGDENDDILFGSEGNDTLNGGSGRDILNGGTGNDTFIFGQGYERDSVNGFANDVDTLNILGSEFGIDTIAELLDPANGHVTQVDANTVRFDFGAGDIFTVNGESDFTIADLVDDIILG